MRRLLGLLAMVVALPVGAGDVTCGSTAETDRQARDLARFVSKRAAKNRLSTNAVRPSRVVNDFLIVGADEQIAPFDDPADLEGMSFLFVRKDANAYTVSRDATFAYDEAVGPLFESFGRGASTKLLPLTEFAFPLGAQTYSLLTLSVTRGIYFTERPALPARNFAAFEMLTSTEPLISPLLDYVNSPASRPDVYVKQAADAVTITWRIQFASVVDYDIQAVLF